jgi:hypothetical protein
VNIQFLRNLGQPAKLLSGGGQGREVWELYASGPASYSVATGDPIVGPGVGELMSAPCGAIMTQSGNYVVQFQPVSTNTLRPGWIARWFTSGTGGVSVTQNAAGSGMTPGTVVPIVFSGGTGGGAAGTVTVLTATTISISITSTGSYTVAPTATISGTGGTPATLTVAISTTIGQVANGTNLSAETIQFAAVGGEF